MSPRERTRRLFLALWPDEAVRRAIDRECRAIVLSAGGRPIPAENLHVTLAFLGSTRESRVASAIEVVRTIQFAAFELVLGQIKWWRRQELLSLEPTSNSEAIAALAERVQSALRERGFEIERRPFRAHVTLARSVSSEPTLPKISLVSWRVNELKLIESQTGTTGSIYTVLTSQK